MSNRYERARNRESGCDNPRCFNFWPPEQAVVREMLAEMRR